jgi:predicted esterase
LPSTTRASPPGTLKVPGFDDAAVSFPSRGPAGQPLVVATHGAGDNAVWQCEAWRERLGDRGIVLCPAGPRVAWNSDGRYYPDHFALEKIVLASLEALRRTLPDPSVAARGVYTGYSQGATMGALMIVSHGGTFPRLALVEGGFEGWTFARAMKFKKSGGERVLFVCGTGHCRKHATTSARALERSGVATRVVADLSAGHTYGGAVERILMDSFAWLVEGVAGSSP